MMEPLIAIMAILLVIRLATNQGPTRGDRIERYWR